MIVKYKSRLYGIIQKMKDREEYFAFRDIQDGLTAIQDTVESITIPKPVTNTSIGAVPTTRLINTVPPLNGGGDLSADRTLGITTFVGDTGTGGARGTVPAPSAGDAAAGRYLKADGTWEIPPTTTGGGGGTVISVGLSAPTEFVVTGSPVTTSGTIALTKSTEVANSVWAGPATGAAAIPTFRALIAGDIPPIPETGVINLTSDLALKAPLASPALSGTPTSPTVTVGDNSTKIATTAFVQSQITSSAPGLAPVQSVAGKTGVVTLVEADVANLVTDLAAKAPTTRLINTTSPLLGGGDLSADRTLGVDLELIQWRSPIINSNLIAPTDTVASMPGGLLELVSGVVLDLSNSTGLTCMEIQ